MILASDGGGGGGTILIVPSTLTASARRLQGVSRELAAVQSKLGGVTVPDLPPGVAGVVHDALSTARSALVDDPQLIDANATELTRRAFWAEFADRMMSGYTLTGVDRAHFIAWMKDGTLMEYADDYDAAAAGKELAHVYSGFRDDPNMLIDLAACLRGGQENVASDVAQAFGAGFVNEFGAKNMELVPRVLQAMEYSRSLGMDMSGDDPFLLRDVAAKYGAEGGDLKQNPLDILAPFCLSLANATMSGQLTRQVEDDIANSPDEYSTAALVSSGTFSKEFLLKVFRHDVVDRIANDSRYDSMGGLAEAPHDSPYALGRLFTHGKEGLPYDTKQTVLDALARNPDAAQAALTQQLSGVDAYDRYGQSQSVTDPLDLLYKYGHFQDDGSAFGHAYAAAADSLNASPDTKLEGAQMTRHALQLMLGGDDGMGGFKDGIATDLAHNHIGDLFDAAQIHDSGGDDVIHIHDGKVIPSSSAAIQILKSLGDQPSALQTLLHSAAAEQAALVHDGTASGPHGSGTWAYKVGAFDAQVLAGADLHRVEDFNASDERHKLIVGFVKNVLDDTVSIDNPVLGAAAHTGIDSLVDNAFPGPEAEKTILDNFNAKTFMQNSLHAQVAAGYHDHGYVHAPKSIQSDDGRLISYSSSTGDQRLTYESWMNGDDKVDEVARNAYNEIDRAFNDNSVDLFR